MDNSDNNQTQYEFRRILAAIDNFRQQDRTASGMVFTDNWYDSHPRLLIFDPVLNPYDKIVWLAIRARCAPDMSLTAFPSYNDIQSCLHISRGTVSSSIAKLRITRWITLLCRERMRNAAGQFTKDGNIYMVHGEPLGLGATFELDANYMGFLYECTSHRRAEIRKLADLIIGSIRQEVETNRDVLIDQHPFERRADSWANLQGDIESKFFDFAMQLHDLSSNTIHTDKQLNDQETQCPPVVHEVNYGRQLKPQSLVGNSSSSSNKKNYDYYITDKDSTERSNRELIFPSSLTENQKYLITLHLKRLPQELPPPPDPWKNWEQVLLDELEGRIQIGKIGKCEPVWNPVSLMSAYCQRLFSNGIGLKEDGKFQVELGEAIILKRNKRAEAEIAYKARQNNYRRKTIERMKDD